ncbi:MAG: hypothetical protein ACRCTF_08285 [Bacteroidales bacterium]
MIKIDLSQVTNIDIASITILLSVVNDLGENGVKVKGNLPINQTAYEVIKNSGFLDHLKSNHPCVISKNAILKRGDVKTTQTELSAEIPKITQTVWGEASRLPPLYECLVEMMINSCDHAFDNKSNVRWYLSVSHLENQNRVIFSFVDNGKGIVNTLKQTKLKRFFSMFKDNIDMLKTAFDEGHESRTGLEWRGKGLTTICENAKNNYICNLKVITNDVFIDFDNKSSGRKLRNTYQGTCYLWEINLNCTPPSIKAK